MKLEQLYQIIEIEKYHSISKAAKALYMGRPSLSESLNNLEEEIGVSLFERSPGGVSATPEGMDILNIAERIIEGVDEILNYSEQVHELRGDVDVYITPSYGFLFSSLLLEFDKRFPKANLHLNMVNSEEAIETLSQGKGCIGMIMWGCVSQQKLENIKSVDLQFEAFQSHVMFLYVSVDNPLAQKESVTLEEIRNEKFIAYSAKHWASINRLIQADSDALVMLDRGALMQLINENQGVAVLPETFAQKSPYYESGSIKLIPIEGSNSFCNAIECLIWPNKRKLTLLEQKTLELLRDILSNFASLDDVLDN